jgi:hypothetical protein
MHLLVQIVPVTVLLQFHQFKVLCAQNLHTFHVCLKLLMCAVLVL